MPLFAPRVCFVDLETTGGAPLRDRVTEVAIVAVERDGAALRTTEWSSLVNPEVPIPTEIQWLTGITQDMVRAAPPFGALAGAIAERLHEAVFVAHNARFDYGFLKAEFARLGIAFSARTLCTVRLSRLLYPDRAPHSLDAIVQRFALDGEQRHRALGDARVLWRFLQRLYERLPGATVDAAVARLLSRPSTPAHLPPEALDDVPAAPGVYRFYGLNAHPIYIGKSIDLKARVAAHFAADGTRAADARLAQEVRRIAWEETAGEIGALLREAAAVRTELPAYNVALRRRAQAVLLRLDETPRPAFVAVAALPPDAFAAATPLAAAQARGDLFGPFSSRAGARAALVALAREHGLCLRTLGLERGPRRARAGGAQAAPATGTAAAAAAPCFAFQLGRCGGACVGQESAAAHGARLRALLAPRRLAPWIAPGAVALVEPDARGGGADWHVADAWCWLGTVRTEDAALALARSAARHFDADTYRILCQALARADRGALRVEPLHAPG